MSAAAASIRRLIPAANERSGRKEEGYRETACRVSQQSADGAGPARPPRQQQKHRSGTGTTLTKYRVFTGEDRSPIPSF